MYIPAAAEIGQFSADKTGFNAPEKTKYAMPELGMNAFMPRDFEAEEKALQDYADKKEKLMVEINESSIRNISTGYSQERMLETARYNEEIKGYSGQSELLELAAQKHWENMKGIQVSETNAMNAKSMEFASYWADTLTSVVEQAGNSFDNIGQMFEQMIKKMMLKAAVMGVLNWVTGGSFIAGAKASFKMQGYANGGDVQAGKPIWVGEKGPEPFIPKTAGTIIPNSVFRTASSSTTHDNSTVNIYLPAGEKADTMTAKRLGELYKEAKDKGYLRKTA